MLIKYSFLMFSGVQRAVNTVKPFGEDESEDKVKHVIYDWKEILSYEEDRNYEEIR